MGEVDRERLEVELARHYAAGRETAAPETIDALAATMVSEDARAPEATKSPTKRPRGASEDAWARTAQRRRMGTAAFVASQVRYIPAWTWAAQVALVACMCALAYAAQVAIAVKLAVGLLSAMTVLVGVPTLHASKLHGVAELEYACPRNAASVLVARLIVLGCSSALAVAVMVCAVASSLDLSAFDVALWAAPPYFLSCAGSLLALRKAPPPAAAALCAIWALACCGALVVFANSFPDMYALASLAVWAGAATVAGAWLARELAMTVRAAATGLDAFSPHMARTYN